MASDEAFLGVVAFAGCVMVTIWWGSAIAAAKRSYAKRIACIVITPLAALLFVFLVLWNWADHEVKSSSGYILALLFLYIAWLGGFTLVMHWLGVSLRQDAVERRNVAAVYGWTGGILGITAVYAGGNVGEGPSLWNNVFSAGLGTIGIIAIWLFLEFMSGTSQLVTVERDIASGLRLGGLMLAVGIIFGRAIAGDWHSASHTVRDFFKQGWIALPITILAMIVNLVAAPTSQNPRPSCATSGVLPVVVYLAIAIWWVDRLGVWK